ncbi:4838_t:CDS:2 [Diversispora eburnea]|uniref:4838_t:CDS:1 n=1 Tax=Diversispora eburnea TaxID=1213867 RepID=A0A9N9B046_9GLOM|nr:4838_t:CDS:2 [Diversispora eburnea]
MSPLKVKEIIFLGTGTSSGVPTIGCLTDPEQNCKTCISTLRPEGEVNIRRNTSLLIRINHEDGRIRNIVIDCGKTFYVSALKWWSHYKLRRIDAIILTHPHADAINGLDDLRAWTLEEVIQDCIPIYLTNDTLDAVKNIFPYLIDSQVATGGGDLPKFQWNLIDSKTPFTIEVHHGVYFTTREPYIYVGFRFDNICYISDCSYIPEETFDKIHGSEIVILDSLNCEPHISHFSIPQAIETSKNLIPIPKRTYLLGFNHKIEHNELAKELKNEPGLWVQPAYDGLKVDIELLSNGSIE